MLPEPTTKRACAGVLADTDASDRLSALPDGPIHAVLSFLPARQLVQTTVLSRRWRDLWCSVPFINIDEREFEIGAGRGVAAKKWNKFEKFTTNLLLFHINAVALDKFQIYAHEHNHRDVDKWIRRGIKYCPAVLNISILNHDAAFIMPPLGSSVCNLRRLHLYNVSLDRRFAELICSDCHALEGLELVECCNYFQDITSHTLKNLHMDSCVHYDTHPVVIMAPRLVSLFLGITDSCYRGGVNLHETASLVKASIGIQSWEFFPAKNQRSLLGSLSSVITLKLHGFETTAMLIDTEEFDEFPMFPDMRTLSLGACFLDDDECDLNGKMEALGSFIQNAPCLEKLTLLCCMFDGNSEMEWDIKRKSINLKQHDQKAFHCEKLKVVEVIYKDDHDHRLVELLWRITKSLPDASITLTKI